jgi:hypothetical protein
MAWHNLTVIVLILVRIISFNLNFVIKTSTLLKKVSILLDTVILNKWMLFNQIVFINS